MNDTVGKCFSHRGMSCSSVYAMHVLIQTERHGKGLLQHRQHSRKKLIEIGFPSAIGVNTIAPTLTRKQIQTLTIIWEKLRTTLWVSDTIRLTKQMKYKVRYPFTLWILHLIINTL